jgi:hypothetical protein
LVTFNEALHERYAIGGRRAILRKSLPYHQYQAGDNAVGIVIKNGGSCTSTSPYVLPKLSTEKSLPPFTIFAINTNTEVMRTSEVEAIITHSAKDSEMLPAVWCYILTFQLSYTVVLY